MERSNTVSREEIAARWGFKCKIKTLFGTPKQNGQQTPDNLAYFTVNKIIQIATKMSQIVTAAKFMNNDPQQLVDSDESKVLNWHMLKGGLKVPELEGVTDVE